MLLDDSESTETYCCNTTQAEWQNQSFHAATISSLNTGFAVDSSTVHLVQYKPHVYGTVHLVQY